MKTYIFILLQLVIVLSLGLQVSVAQDVDFYADAVSKTNNDVPLPLDIDELQLLWETTVGEVGSDSASSLDQTHDGGYIFVGNTNSNSTGNYDIYMVKTDYYGNVEWEITHGGNSNDYGWSVQQTLEGEYIIAGTTSSFGEGSSDGYLIKTSPTGSIIWSKTFGGTKIDEIYSVQQTSDRGFILAGRTESYGYGSGDVFLVRTDSSGKMLWKKTFGGTNADSATSVQETSDNGFIICGSTYSFEDNDGFSDFYLVKTNSQGQLLWERTFGSVGWPDDAYSVKETSDGGYIVTGALRAVKVGSGIRDIGLVKFDKDGNVKWSKKFGGTGRDIGKSVQQTSDGGYIILAETNSYSADNNDMYLIKTNSSGIKEWDKTIGGTGAERGAEIQTTYEGGYIIAGTTDSNNTGDKDFYLIRLGNFVPIANAGGDQTVFADSNGLAEVYLDASDSNDPEGDPLTYKWYWWVDGKAYESTLMSLTIILPIGEHIVELDVNDGRQDSFTAVITITVIGPMEGELWVLPRPIKRNRGPRWIRVSLCPPDGIEANQIDVSKPLKLFPGDIQSIRRQRIRNSRIDGVRRTYVYAFFDKAPLMAAIPKNGNAELTVVGHLITGHQFYGVDPVLIIEKVGREWDQGDSYVDPNDGSGDDGKDDPKDDGKTDDKGDDGKADDGKADDGKADDGKADDDTPDDDTPDDDTPDDDDDGSGVILI